MGNRRATFVPVISIPFQYFWFKAKPAVEYIMWSARLNLFKGRARREQERLEQEAKINRAYERGKEIASEIARVVDHWFEIRVVPGGQKLNDSFRETLEKTHKQTEAEVAAQFQFCLDVIEEYKTRMPNEVHEFVEEYFKEAKDMMTEMGMREIADEYIQARLNPIVERVTKNVQDEAAYALARVRGMITDEQHAMSIEELKQSLGKA